MTSEILSVITVAPSFSHNYTICLLVAGRRHSNVYTLNQTHLSSFASLRIRIRRMSLNIGRERAAHSALPLKHNTLRWLHAAFVVGKSLDSHKCCKHPLIYTGNMWPISGSFRYEKCVIQSIYKGCNNAPYCPNTLTGISIQNTHNYPHGNFGAEGHRTPLGALTKSDSISSLVR